MAFTATTAVAMVALGAFVYYRVEATLTEQAHGSLETQMEALARVPPERLDEAAADMSGQTFAQVLTPEARPVHSSPQIVDPLISVDRIPGNRGQQVAVEKSVRFASGNETEAALLLVRHDVDRILVVGTSQEDKEDALGGVLTQLLIGVPLALGLAAGMGYLVAGSALRPMERMRQRAATISAGSSGDRLPLPAAHDEIRRLGLTLNQMLDRLDAALKRERRFVAEASHELKTPLALLRMELDLALSRPRSSDELLAALRSANEEVHRLTRLSEDLLLLAASDEGELRLDQQEFDLGALLDRVVNRFSAAADGQGCNIRVEAGFPMIVRADQDSLDRAVSNLLDNALRHGAGDVGVTAHAEGEAVAICVTDQGPGISTPLRERAFDPFTRQSSARTPEAIGLGLTIVRAIVQRHGGTITITDGPNGGTVIRIDLPIRRLTTRD